MSSKDWMVARLGDVIEFNPRESIKKGSPSKKIGMDKLNTFQRKIEGYEVASFSGGSKFRNGDTLLARITPCLENGKTAQVTILEKDEVAFGSTEFIVLREKEGCTDNDFIFYLSLSAYIRETAIKSMTGTSGRQRAQTDVIENTKIKLPPLVEQKAIAHVLSTLDDKIEVNNRINKTLEDMAQAIFKRWFVDFEFPNEDGEPYKSSGGEMLESELGMIPKGWKTGVLQDLGKVVGGSTPSKKNEDYYTQEGIAWITPKDLSNNHDVFIRKGAIDISPEGLKNTSTFLLPKGSILFSSRAPIGYVAIADQELTTNQGFKSIIPGEQFGTSFVYCALNQMTEKIKSRASGSTFLEVSGSVMKSIETLLPETKIIQKFNQLSIPLFKTIKLNENQIKRLISCRDILLPKLMSGEIRVHEYDRV